MPVTIGRPRVLLIRGPSGSRGLPGGGTTTGGAVAANPIELIVFTQDGVNPRLLTIPGTDTWVPESIRVYFRGQRLDTPLLVVSGTGNRTVTLDATVPIQLGDYTEGDGVKA